MASEIQVVLVADSNTQTDSVSAYTNSPEDQNQPYTMQTELSGDNSKRTALSSPYQVFQSFQSSEAPNMGEVNDKELQRKQFSKTIHYKNYKKMSTGTVRNANIGLKFASRSNQKIGQEKKIRPVL